VEILLDNPEPSARGTISPIRSGYFWGFTAVQPAVLFNYVGPSTVDRDFLHATMDGLIFRKPTPPLSQAKLDKRGFLSFVFDGRYKFGRYYAPTAFNTPRTLDEILGNNDVQLFDLQGDPEEMRNLALGPEKNGARTKQSPTANIIRAEGIATLGNSSAQAKSSENAADRSTARRRNEPRS